MNNNIIGLEVGTIELFPHNINWKNEFEKEKNRLLPFISEHIKTIEHIGSTSIKDIHAKPIIDMCVGLEKFEDGFKCVEFLEKLGYESLGEFGIKKRHYFRNNGNIRKFHIHMFEIESYEYKKHIFFRDFMNKNPKEAQEYSNLKLEIKNDILSNKNLKMDDYTEQKSPFITLILEKMIERE